MNPGDKIVNKLYTRDIYEKNSNDFSILEIRRTYNINITDPLFTDLFDKFPRTNIPQNIKDKFGETTDILSTTNIIKYYKSIGVKKLIMFDFSCSTFDLDDIDPKKRPRVERQLRHTIEKDSLSSGGSKKKHSSRKKHSSKKRHGLRKKYGLRKRYTKKIKK